MINNHILFVILIFFIVSTSCRNTSEEEGVRLAIDNLQPIEIDNRDLQHYIELDSLLNIDSLSFLPLETSGDNTIGVVSSLIKVDSLFIIYDNELSEFSVYNESGRFIRQVGMLGKGPEEHLEIMDSRYNSYSHLLEMSDMALILRSYNFNDGTLVNNNKKIVKDYHGNLFYPLDKETYALYNNFGYSESGNYRFFIVNIEGKLLHKSLPFNNKDQIRTAISNKQFYMAGDSVRFFESFNPIIYNVTKKGLEPKYYIKYTKNNIDLTLLNEPGKALNDINNDEISTLNDVVETSNYFFASFTYDRNYRGYTLFNKMLNKTHGSSFSGYYIKSVNLPITGSLYAVGDDRLIAILDAAEIISWQGMHKNNNKISSAVSQKISDLKLHEFSNPVLVTLKFK